MFLESILRDLTVGIAFAFYRRNDFDSEGS
jgi:hypothetical protein